MPIRRELYAEDWEAISHRIRFVRAGGKCEGCVVYPECSAEHGKLHPVTGVVVWLQTAHWPDPSQSNNAEQNLHAWCARCHNTMDGLLRWETRRRLDRERQREAGQLEFQLTEDAVAMRFDVLVESVEDEVLAEWRRVIAEDAPSAINEAKSAAVAEGLVPVRVQVVSLGEMSVAEELMARGVPGLFDLAVVAQPKLLDGATGNHYDSEGK